MTEDAAPSDPAALTRHIETRYHARHREQLPQLAAMAERVEDVHFFAFGFQQADLLKTREYTRYGFHCKAQIVTDFVARHRQAELVGRKAPSAEAC